MIEDPDDARRVGVEIEFAGLDSGAAARAVAEALGGQVEIGGPHKAQVTGTPLGTLEFELDTRYAHPPEKPGGLVDRALDGLGARAKAIALLSTVVPVEIITEPLARAQYPLLEQAVTALRHAGAEGTGDSSLYAFGMHLNIAPGHGGPERALRIAAAFTFAERWLRERWPIDPARRLVPFVDPYPRGWRIDLGELMADGAAPELGAFVRLYRVYNPNRNRALDLWPLLGHLAPEIAAAAHGAPIRNARPAFHYRWPDSRVGEAGWNPWAELDRWLLIERAADDPDRLERIRRESVGVESGASRVSAYMALLDQVMA